MTSKDFLFTGTPRPQLTCAQNKILDYLVSHPDDVAYMSSAELAEKLSMSNATVVRFSQHIGFKGYLDLQHHIRQEIKSRLKVPERVKKAPPNINHPKDFLKTVLKSDRENLTRTMQTIPEELFDSAVKDLQSKNEIWVLGLRSCYGAAHYFATNLRFLSRRVNLINLDSGTVWSQIQPGLNSDALLVSLTFPRYCRHTLEITEQFHRAGATIIAITDSHTSPLAQMGTYVFPLPFWIDSFFESAAAVISFLNAMLSAVSFMDGHKTMAGLKALEQIWDDQQVYSTQTQQALPTWAGQFKTKPKN